MLLKIYIFVNPVHIYLQISIAGYNQRDYDMEEVSLCGLEHFIQYLDYKKRLRPTCVSTSHTHSLIYLSITH